MCNLFINHTNTSFRFMSWLCSSTKCFHYRMHSVGAAPPPRCAATAAVPRGARGCRYLPWASSVLPLQPELKCQNIQRFLDIIYIFWLLKKKKLLQGKKTSNGFRPAMTQRWRMGSYYGCCHYHNHLLPFPRVKGFIIHFRQLVAEPYPFMHCSMWKVLWHQAVSLAKAEGGIIQQCV